MDLTGSTNLDYALALTEPQLANTEDYDFTYNPFRRSSKELLKRGILCIPIPRQEKGCALKDWPTKASVDPVQIEKWEKQNPQQNAGAVCTPSTICVLDIDDLEIIKTLPQPLPDTFVVRTRKGLHVYFLQTDATRNLGNTSASDPLDPKHHLFDFQQNNKYVVAPYSIHSGIVYTILKNVDITLCPDWLSDWIKEKAFLSKPAPAPIEEHPSSPTRLMLGGKCIYEEHPLTKDQFEAWLNHHNESVESAKWKEASDNRPARWEYIRTEECPWAEEHTNKNAPKDFAIYFSLDGKPGIHCCHSHKKQWSDYRAFLVKKTGYDFSMVTGEMFTSTPMQSSENNPAMEPTEITQSDIVYPLQVWEGTLYSDFAKLCTQDNFMPPEFFIESLKTVCGAIMADRVKTVSNISPRFYTILVAESGTGKGTSINWSTDVFAESFIGTQVRPALLWTLGKDEKRLMTNIGAQKALIASDAGFFNAITSDPHTLICASELQTLLSPTHIEGSGTRLMTNYLNLYDSTEVQVGQTKDRLGSGGKAYLSILSGGTQDIWDSAFDGAKADGTGIYNRFNLVVSDNIKVVADLKKPDITSFVTALRTKFDELHNAKIEATLDNAAKELFVQWFGDPAIQELPINVKGRVNVLALKNALHMVWLEDTSISTGDHLSEGDPQQPIKKLTITKSIMERAIALSNYQINVRKQYTPAESDNPQAVCENKIRKYMRKVKKTTMRDLRRGINAARYGSKLFFQSVTGLKNTGEIEWEYKGNNKAIDVMWVDWESSDEFNA